MKIFFRRIHLYLGFSAGLIIMISCFTGAILVFEEELQHATNHKRYFTDQVTQPLPLQVLLDSVKQKVPGCTIVSVRIFSNNARNAEINYTKTSTKKVKEGAANLSPGATGSANRKAPSPENRQTAFVNRYTGNVVELYNHKDSFFYAVLSLHRWLLAGTTGKLITGISTLIFIFILITGIVLWWPKTKKILAQRLRIKTDGGWKRINHDLHIVFGFYSSLILFIFSFTALAWSFDWFNKGIYKVTGSSMKPFSAPVITNDGSRSYVSYDAVFATVSEQEKEAKFYTINTPKDSSSPFVVSVLGKNAPHESATDNYYINPYSTEIIAAQPFSQRNTGQKVRAVFKPIHVSSIFGTWSKIIGFIVCLLGTTFPVTGFILWLNRTRKASKNKETVARKYDEDVIGY